jgi:hypothetical protein
MQRHAPGAFSGDARCLQVPHVLGYWAATASSSSLSPSQRMTGLTPPLLPDRRTVVNCYRPVAVGIETPEPLGTSQRSTNLTGRLLRP